MTSSRDFFETIGIIFVSFIIFIYGIAGQEIIGFDSRFYLFALEMWRHGPSWFPTTYLEPYPDYPAASTFLIYLVSTLGGHLDKLTAVMPSAFVAAVTVGVTYRIGALHNKRWGFYAALLLIFTVTYLKSARSISLDMYSTLITAWCFYLVYSADLKDLHEREWYLYPLFFVGFMFRGPIGLIIPTGVVCVYYLLDRNIKNLLFTAMFSLFVLIISSFILLSLAASTGGEAFMKKVLIMEVFGRFSEGGLPFYYYIVHALDNYVISSPLALFVALGAIYYRLRLHHLSHDMKLLLKLVGWVVVVVVGMSIPGDKKIRYILPVAPALALLASYPFIANKQDHFFDLLHSVFLYFFALVPLCLLVAYYLVAHHFIKSFSGVSIDYPWMMSVLLTAFSFSIMALFRFKKEKHWRDTTILLVATLCFVMLYIKIAEVVQYHLDRARETVAFVEEKRSMTMGQLIFYKMHPDGLPIKYLINMSREDKPLFIDKPEALTTFIHPVYVVTTRKIYNELPVTLTSRFNVLIDDNLGHVPVVIFTNAK